ncbi:MAG: choice-of-anchor F family protein, partial [Sulfuricurvum sp.]|nr:choice-of-anchor F family protein [Sulfuricurvum sp.]
MKTETKKRLLGFSIAAALLLGTTTYAGKIITNATYDNNVTSSSSAIITDRTQFGYTGWDMSNVFVKITDLVYQTILKTFNEVTGLYDAMVVGDSFESEISTGGEVRALLHGKNWPVGEPSGIKVINDDLAVHEGDPQNCIIGSSYLEGHYLDQPNATDRWPTICSSGFQTHKRFKVNMLPSTVTGVDFNATGGYGKPFELVFKLDPTDTSTAVRRYVVLQKINNYTGTILDGYKLEVLDENGTKNPNLFVTLDKYDEVDGYDDMANFSHGLWGEIDTHFTTEGFFDNKKSYYPVVNTDNQTVEWHGDIQGGNYMAVFRSNWLHRTLAPYGIFFDDDNDTTTDAKLLLFKGVPPTLDANTTPGWYTGFKTSTINGIVYPGWTLVDPAVVTALKLNPLYTEDVIDDTLNLGITYTVNVGNNAAIGSKFTIRITPHVDGTSVDSPIPPAPVVPTASSDGSGGGFDALDNVSLIAMILGFLGIGAFIARRRLA